MALHGVEGVAQFVVQRRGFRMKVEREIAVEELHPLGFEGRRHRGIARIAAEAGVAEFLEQRHDLGRGAAGDGIHREEWVCGGSGGIGGRSRAEQDGQHGHFQDLGKGREGNFHEAYQSANCLRSASFFPIRGRRSDPAFADGRIFAQIGDRCASPCTARSCSCFLFSGLGRAQRFDQANSVLSLSHYDEVNPDFASLTRAGVLGVIHEATFPAFDHDPKYVLRQNEAARAGMLWGAYHFGNSTDAKRQADHFLDFVQENWRRGEGAARPEKVLLKSSMRSGTRTTPGGSMDVSEAVRFIERVHDRTGVYPGLYSNENWIKRMFANPALDPGSKRVLGNCWLWIANYHYVPVVTTPWSKWMLWQYTGDGTCELPRSRYPVDVANLYARSKGRFSAAAARP